MNQEIMDLMKPVPMSDEEKELRAWIKKCARANLFGDRDPREIAYLALLNDFPRELVYSVLSCFRDAIEGSHVDSRAAFQFLHFSQAVATAHRMRDELTKPKELDLSPLWLDVTAYQTGETKVA